MYFLFVNFFFFGFVFLFVGAYLDYFSFCVQGSWDLGLFDCVYYCFDFFLDGYCLQFLGVIFLVSSVILFYSYGYVDFYSLRFCYMMILFVVSMFFLVISPNLFSMLLGWDGLGVISFCLVGFYYGSDYSCDCSLITILYNRFGDAMLLVGLGFCYVLGGFSFFYLYGWFSLLGFFVLLGLCTKSAQYPFSSWLPKAMAAPTPVSSLVHSSTLVTSGMYILFRYSFVLDGVFYLLFYLSFLTMILGGVLSLLSYDIKKVIAYSTLSQMGFMLNSLSLGAGDFMYFHMLIHAIFKSMMFMCAGVIIHLIGYQDLRVCSGLVYSVPLTIYMMFLGVISLMGFPFMCGFYSKDLIVDYVLSNSEMLVFVGFYYFGISLTMAYGSRLFYYLVCGGVGFSPLICVSEGFISYGVGILSFLSLFLGAFFVLFYFGLSLYGGVGGLVGCFVGVCLILGICLMCCSLFSFSFFNLVVSWFFVDSFFLGLKGVVVYLVKIGVFFDKFWLESLMGYKFYFLLRGAYGGFNWAGVNLVFLLLLLMVYFIFLFYLCNLY